MKLTAIAKSLVVVFVVVAAAAGATYALFSDEVTIGESTFSVASADGNLKIWDGDSYEDTTTGFTTPDMFPGQTADPFYFWLKNFAPFDMDVTAALTGTDNTDLGNVVYVKFECDPDGDLNFSPAGSEWTVNQWIGGSDTFPDLGSGLEYQCLLVARLDSSADNSVSGQDLLFGATFTGTQIAE